MYCWSDLLSLCTVPDFPQQLHTCVHVCSECVYVLMIPTVLLSRLRDCANKLVSSHTKSLSTRRELKEYSHRKQHIQELVCVCCMYVHAYLMWGTSSEL